MKRSRIRSILTVALVAVGLAAPKLEAQFECTQERMAGAWVVQGELEVLPVEGSPLLEPPPLTGPFSALGITVLDEQGRATAAFQTNTTAIGAFTDNFLAEDRPGGPLDVQVTMNSDCTGSWVFTDRASGGSLFELETVCGNAQRECWATWIQSFGNTTPPDFNGLVKLKRVDAIDQQLEAKVDALATDIAVVKANIGMLSRRLGLVPKE